VDTGHTDRFLAELSMRKSVVVQHETDDIRSALGEITAQTPFEDTQATNDAPTVNSTAPFEHKSGGSDAPTVTTEVAGNTTRDKTASAIARHLTPARREKILGALGKGAARINALAVEVGISILGRKLKEDAIVTDEDLEILRLGYDLLIEEIFETLEPKPWHVIVAGNVFLIMSIWSMTEKKPKKQVEQVPVQS